MPSRRNFLKGLAAGAVALGIGTVEAVKAAPVAEAPIEVSGYVVEQRVHRSFAEMRQSAWYQDAFRRQVMNNVSEEIRQQELAKLRGQIVDMPQDWTITPMSYSYVDPTSIHPTWNEDGQLSKVLKVPPAYHFGDTLNT